MCNISKQQQKKLNIENIKDLTQCPISLKLFHVLCFIYLFIVISFRMCCLTTTECLDVDQSFPKKTEQFCNIIIYPSPWGKSHNPWNIQCVLPQLTHTRLLSAKSAYQIRVAFQIQVILGEMWVKVRTSSQSTLYISGNTFGTWR